MSVFDPSGYNKLQLDMLVTLDPSKLMSIVGLSPDVWQQDFLWCTDPYIQVLCCRQAGKSTAAGVKAMSAAMEGGALVLMFAPTLRQSGELFAKAIRFWKPLRSLYPAESISKLTLTLKNGSRIVALPGTEGTTVGFSAPRCIILDEATLVDAALYKYVRPMLATSKRGQLVSLGTPRGKQGWFYDDWIDATSPNAKFTITADKIGRFSPAFLAAERKAMGDLWYEQEYMCKFHDLENSLFTLDQIERNTVDQVEPLFSEEVEVDDISILDF